jgi:flagellar biosynthesis GTPase FlhF
MKDANGMKIKSYFAKSVDEAISKARVELGSDALLLNTRKVADTGTGASGYEVVMGVTGPAPVSRAAAPAATPKPALPRETAVPQLKPAQPIEVRPEQKPQARSEAAADMDKLRAQMDE